MTIRIDATRRQGQAAITRVSGLIPAVLYGRDIKSKSVAVGKTVFTKVYEKAGESTLIDFVIESETPTKVLIQEVQRDPVKHQILHVDFRQVNMSEKMHVTIPLVFVGEAAAVRELGGTLVTSMDEVNVTCLPTDLVSSIEVSLTELRTFDNKITIADLTLPIGITITDHSDITIVSVSTPLTDSQLKAIEEENARGMDSVESLKKESQESKESEEAAETNVADKNKSRAAGK